MVGYFDVFYICRGCGLGGISDLAARSRGSAWRLEWSRRERSPFRKASRILVRYNDVWGDRRHLIERAALYSIKLGGSFARVADDGFGIQSEAMLKPISFYLELVDQAALDKAESGDPIGMFDRPAAPLFVFLIIGLGLASFTAPNSAANYVIIIAAVVTAFGAWAWINRFYSRRLAAYRSQVANDDPIA